MPGVVLASLIAAAPASATPKVVAADFDRPTVTGTEVNLRIRAVDPGAPVNGMIVRFGRELFALSACRPAGSDRRAPGGPFAHGAPVTLQAPHTFSRTGVHGVLARVDSGGCGPAGGSVFQPVIVIPTRPGTPPTQPAFGPSTSSPALLPRGPGLPGSSDLPGPLALPGSLSATDLSAAATVRMAAARCPGASRRVRNTAASRREATANLLCVMNAARRRKGLRGLRMDLRLQRAATAHSRSMVQGGYFSHIGPGGVALISRLRRAGYLPARRWLAGENLAAGAGGPLGILRAWLRSPPHRQNIYLRSFRHVGLGVVSGLPRRSRSRGATYTANFGFRR